jgi:hypothetical protein
MCSAVCCGREASPWNGPWRPTRHRDTPLDRCFDHRRCLVVAEIEDARLHVLAAALGVIEAKLVAGADATRAPPEPDA